MREYNDLPLIVRVVVYTLVGVILVYLSAPLLLVLPMSVSSDPWFTYPLPGVSWRWFEAFFNNPLWISSIKNSLIIGVCTTLLATTLGTSAAIGLINPKFPFRNAVFVLILTPLIVPVVVSGLGFYLFFSKIGLLHSFPGIILAHTVLATPFVVVTVTATLSRFDFNLMRAATSLGASRLTAFRTVMLPMIAPGVVAGGVFAFITSFDEVVAVLFIAGPEQRTLPRQLFSGMREQLEPTIISASVIVIILTVVLMLLAGRLQRQKV